MQHPVLGRRALMAALLAGAALPVLRTPAHAQPAPRGFPQITGNVFTPKPKNPLAPPRVSEIPVPPFADSHAIWGATGRDDRGHIWFGVAAVNDHFSAHLMEYDPVSRRMTDRGDVLSALRSVRPLRPGEGQIKIHSRITQADDGFLYFTSTDEEGEQDDGSAPPKWGSHLWRLRPPDGAEPPKWEHLLEVPEGLTCAGAVGRTVYAVGLWDHVLYSYDTITAAVRRKPVGSVGGHMSRSLLIDATGHAFVPRVTKTAKGLSAELVEFSPDLTEIGATRLDYYADGQTPSEAHGILGFTFLADQSLVFTTGIGHLYRVTRDPARTAAVPAAGKATVEALGWIHPKGHSYTPSLFVWDGIDTIAAVGLPATGEWDWIVFDLKTRKSKAATLPQKLGARWELLLYGTHTRDDKGRFYVVGRLHRGAPRTPVILQIDAT